MTDPLLGVGIAIGFAGAWVWGQHVQPEPVDCPECDTRHGHGPDGDLANYCVECGTSLPRPDQSRLEWWPERLREAADGYTPDDTSDEWETLPADDPRDAYQRGEITEAELEARLEDVLDDFEPIRDTDE